MTTSTLAPSPAGTGRAQPRIRPGTLVDVPAAARLVSGGGPGPARGPVGLDEATRRSLLRMVLAHVALEEGGFWVAATADGALDAVCALLPPHDPAAGASIDGAVRLELGLDVAARGGSAATAVPGGCWVLLAPGDDVDPATAAALVARATAVLDAVGDPAVAPADGGEGAGGGVTASALCDAGFRRSPAAGLLLRPARRHLRLPPRRAPRGAAGRCTR